ncbi:PH domain-containing protein [Pengzhenrongella sicca]|uniref:PH domain-containing protein n=1 Tax=Pengzhenrongella sicca TaxID=2819238 RepID=A0A8A4ZGQ3_9MICO|nr:PH domain-containing protein [Pengzhenrongella sicca]QTE28828.1 PH domain-containing protein [Pengzhenrongella sicca]
MSSAPSGQVFRPRSALPVAVVLALGALAWAGSAVVDDGAAGLLRQLPAIVLATTAAAAVLVRPTVTVGPAGVALRGVLRDVDVPWAELAEVRTQYALTLVTRDGRRFAAWAAPAAGRFADARLTPREVAAMGLDPARELPTVSGSVETPSGAVADWVRRAWDRAPEDEPPGAASGGPGPGVRTRPARAVLAAVGIAAALWLARSVG